MQLLYQGLLLGFIIILPGMSGGTIFIILGIYEKLLRDISKLKLLPYWPFLGGTLLGIFLGGTFFSILLTSLRDVTVAFLMGVLLASIKAVLKNCPRPNFTRLFILIVGFVVGFLIAGEPLGVLTESREVNWFLLIFGGAFSSATMLIPGVPGSSILIVLGIYDDVLFYVKDFALDKLVVFGAGGAFGIFLLARFLARFYSRYRVPTAYFFAGLISGSARILLPSSWHLLEIIVFLAGFAIVWRWGGVQENAV